MIDRLKKIISSAKQKREIRRATVREKQEREKDEWRVKYFSDIVFPIIILRKKDYLSVSDLAEYYYDVDINIWFVNADCVLADSTGQTYDFKQIKEGPEEPWVPNNKIGNMNHEELIKILTPRLFMPNHKKDINSTTTIRDIIQLLMTE